MKIKVIVLLILTFLLCGCSVEYNLEIKDNNFVEQIRIGSSSFAELDEIINDPWPQTAYFDVTGSSETPMKIEGFDYYEKEINESVYYKYTFDRNSFERSRAFNECFANVAINELNNNTIISTGSYNLCFDKYNMINEMTIKIILDKNIISHNADKIEGKSLIWNYNHSNYKNKSIQLEFGTKDIDDEKNKNENFSILGSLQVTSIVIIYVFCSTIIVFLIVLFIKRRSSKNNKI